MYRLRASVPALLALTTFVALSSSLIAGRPASASASPPAPASVDSVLVSGTGEVFGEPDTLTANFAVETSASTVGDALTRASTAATRMRDALERGGVAAADLQTSYVSISSERNDQGTITGYTVAQGLTATIRDLPRAGALMSEAVAAGGDAARLNGVSFSVEDDTALMAEARTKAFADARAKAELYAREAGRPLGRVVRVSEVQHDHFGPAGQDLRTGAGMPVPVEPGTQRLAVTVTVEWALRPRSA